MGLRFFCCENLAFQGDLTPVLTRHTKNFAIEDWSAIGVDRTQRNFDPLKRQIEEWQGRQLSTAVAKLIIYQAFIEDALEAPKPLARMVHELCFQPAYPEFEPSTLSHCATCCPKRWCAVLALSTCSLRSPGSVTSVRLGRAVQSNAVVVSTGNNTTEQPPECGKSMQRECPFCSTPTASTSASPNFNCNARRTRACTRTSHTCQAPQNHTLPVL